MIKFNIGPNGYSLCFNGKHITVNNFRNVYADECESGAIFFSPNCDGSCSNGEDIQPDQLDEIGQAVIGYFEVVPRGVIWIRISQVNSACLEGECFEFQNSGSEIAPAKLASGHLLKNGEQITVHQLRRPGIDATALPYRTYDKDWQITNIGGRADVRSRVSNPRSIPEKEWEKIERRSQKHKCF